ncbi:putative amino acid transporter [Leishmania infantum JPCM5]|uniref:Amino_acid_permease_24_-_putative n=2 Tax=Leishmania infantum TaxID=5671 RepID=A0A6L0WKJ5_LEIIN|nr:putative amino acid transporter [Leishmania infantum JPCM5]CAC9457955.1 amino_acid_permease_24_-_putative [Leishmania infantum]CAC9457975.1 amino_acid_permease_24_-_putative [Leishmania infantum]CAM66091.1 putative amino acid transporter [Leishmania infantum JPCM5]SUZ39708.1 amino_acid_permease_24_-_putative [Leishmania infantum]SUZ39709.1 amino_acid_permease_24_-_putative [Leishmania infantum]|eukprot:XP_001463724.1 putative amino acid transporter [Leishmania infantum JPCM5]
MSRLPSTASDNEPAHLTQMEDERYRETLIEGFMSVPEVEGDEGASNGDPSCQQKDQKAQEYVEMDDDDDMTVVRLAAGELKENTNICKSAFHVFKANVGTGVFLLPTFYPDAGYVVSVILGVLIGAAVVDCTRLLVDVKIKINRSDVTTYSQVCRYVCGAGLGWFLFVAMCLAQFGFCLMYTQLFGDTMVELANFKGSKYLWVSVVFFLCFPMTCFSDNLSLLAIASIIATVSVFYSLICCFVMSLVQLSQDGVHPGCDVAGNRIPVGWFNNLANNMMVLEGIAIILPVHAACTQKRLVPKMATLVITGVIAWYILFGLTGYLAYGNSMTTSLVAKMAHSSWGTSVRVFFMLNLVFTYPVQFMSAMQLIDQTVRCKPRSWMGIGLRLLINLVIWALAMGMPTSAVNTVVAFVGALPSVCMVMIIPSILAMHVKYAVEHPDADRNTLQYWKKIFVTAPCFTFKRIRCYVYLVVAVLIMVIGTYSIAETL